LYAKYRLHNFGDETFTPIHPGAVRSHGYLGFITGGPFILLASVDESRFFSLFQTDRKRRTITLSTVHPPVDISSPAVVFDIKKYTGKQDEVFHRWASDYHKSPIPEAPATGWTSWYYYYTDISEEIILSNLEEFSSRQIPLDFFQIDDGWQTAVGDWLSVKEIFPNGMGAVAERIRSAGYTPGLWLAPFICEASSRIAADHPDWIIRDRKDRPVVLGANPEYWSGKFYPLDVYNNEFQEYLAQVFNTVFNDWDYGMVKLDFLYGACFKPAAGKTRAQTMDQAMGLLRSMAGKRKILGCGVPITSAFGTTDYCRIGSDVAGYWEDGRLAFIRYPERVSTNNSIINTINRSWLNGTFLGNDPDVFLLRSNRNELTAVEKLTLLTVNTLFGSLIFTSDNIGEYSDTEMELYLSHFPHRHKEIEDVKFTEDFAVVKFSNNGFKQLALINLGNKEKTHTFDTSLSDSKGRHFPAGSAVTTPAHGSAVLLVLPETEGLIRSTGQLYPGNQFETFQVEDTNITYAIHEKCMSHGSFYVLLKTGYTEVEVNGEATATVFTDGMNAVKVDY
jgi:alpha-galactosidase